MHIKKRYEGEFLLRRKGKTGGCAAEPTREEAGEDTSAHNYPSGPLGVSTVPSSTGRCTHLGQVGTT